MRQQKLINDEKTMVYEFMKVLQISCEDDGASWIRRTMGAEPSKSLFGFGLSLLPPVERHGFSLWSELTHGMVVLLLLDPDHVCLA